jgi:hypothetical protein
VLLVITLFAPACARWIPSALVEIKRSVPGRGITCTWSIVAAELRYVPTPMKPDA